MGYAIYGYPTRGSRYYNRRELLHGNYLISDENNTGPDKKVKRQKKKDGSARGEVNRAKTIQDLPLEVIQRIFVLSLNMRSLPFVNKYLYYTLRPSPSLLHQLTWEKYSLDPLPQCIITNKIPDGQRLLIDDIFLNETFLEFLARHYEGLLSKVYCFIPQAVHHKFLEERNSDIIIRWLGAEHVMYYPGVFSQNMELFFTKKDFIFYLRRFFTLSDPYFTIKALIQWFLREQLEYNFEGFFSTVEFILDLQEQPSRELLSPIPLISLLECLHGPNNFDKLVSKLLESRNPLSKTFTRVSCVKLFIEKFHSDVDSKKELSDPLVWKTLGAISDVQIIDLIIESGGNPQYDMII
ncbi:hypothetical protein HG535_0C01520 [Zygotorulaspora mrakii]|uniref:F-box domain-containing protein n=1 Tax=Zygotorulaspora mrakii TaxID=42260 RepID=A0A7H9AZZ2_ZYGMR|nr:uncharacterized protein HG535_0C01520 [Zygotorulaspora mrakii]QLG71803.1 hypothetical protein HG535_0C01520 [Zygotorulaspora mrakii]